LLWFKGGFESTRRHPEINNFNFTSTDFLLNG